MKSAQEGLIRLYIRSSRAEFDAESRYLVGVFIQNPLTFRKPKKRYGNSNGKMKKINSYIFANKIAAGGSYRIESWSFLTRIRKSSEKLLNGDNRRKYSRLFQVVYRSRKQKVYDLDVS